jgi:hypothetical protein
MLGTSAHARRTLAGQLLIHRCAHPDGFTPPVRAQNFHVPKRHERPTRKRACSFESAAIYTSDERAPAGSTNEHAHRRIRHRQKAETPAPAPTSSNRPAAQRPQYSTAAIDNRRGRPRQAPFCPHHFPSDGKLSASDASPQRPRQLEQLEPAGYNQTLDAEAHSIPLGCILPQSERQSRAVCFRFGTRPPGFDSTSPPGRRCQRSDPVRSASQTIRTAAASRTRQHRTSSRANRKQARSAGVGLHSDQI